MQILTEAGFKDFSGLIERDYRDDLLEITLSTSKKIVCTPGHEFKMSDSVFMPAEFIGIGDILFNDAIVVDIAYGFAGYTYDACNVKDTASFWTDGVISHNCIMLDEFAFVNDAATFYTSTYPVITSGSETKVIITSTPNGIGNIFYRLWEGAVQGTNEFKPFKINWWDVPGRDEKWKLQTIANTSELQFAQEFECIDGNTEVYVLINNNEVKIKLRNLYEAYPLLNNPR